jgi:type III restriction enzyme
MSLFDEHLETYLSSVYPPADDEFTSKLNKTLLQAQRLGEGSGPMGKPFACVLSDSDTESQFAHECSSNERVKFFFKLPSRFKIPTPLGTYNPDWAVVLENDTRVHFVAETKSSTVRANRRPAENLQIDCGRKHFELADGVAFKDVTSLDELLV